MTTQIESLTRAMNLLEVGISRQQAYITLHGEANDKDSDKQWEAYKLNAQYNLDKWDALKAKRDALKIA